MKKLTMLSAAAAMLAAMSDHAPLKSGQRRRCQKDADAPPGSRVHGRFKKRKGKR